MFEAILLFNSAAQDYPVAFGFMPAVALADRPDFPRNEPPGALRLQPFDAYAKTRSVSGSREAKCS